MTIGPGQPDSNTREVLIKLKRKIGRERARYERMGETTPSSDFGRRCSYEANVCTLIMGMIDSEIRKLMEG